MLACSKRIAAAIPHSANREKAGVVHVHPGITTSRMSRHAPLHHVNPSTIYPHLPSPFIVSN